MSKKDSRYYRLIQFFAWIVTLSALAILGGLIAWIVVMDRPLPLKVVFVGLLMLTVSIGLCAFYQNQSEKEDTEDDD